MRFTNRTEYGIICLINMAKRWGAQTMTSLQEIATEEHYSVDFVEKIFQKLRKAHIVISHAGKNGGYALARSPETITLKHIIDALEGSTFDVYCNDPEGEGVVCTHLCLCGMKPIWRKTKHLLDEFYQTITLAHMTCGIPGIGEFDLVKRRSS